MNLLYIHTAKVVKLFILLSILSSCNLKLFSKKKEAKADPISAAIEQQKQQEQQFGMKLKSEEKEKFAKIDKRTAISKKEKESRSRQKSGQKVTLADKYRLARANRKDYLWKKRTERYKRKIIKRRQSEQMKERMKQDRKRIKKRDRKARRKQRLKAFKNLFR